MSLFERVICRQHTLDIIYTTYAVNTNGIYSFCMLIKSTFRFSTKYQASVYKSYSNVVTCPVTGAYIPPGELKSHLSFAYIVSHLFYHSPKTRSARFSCNRSLRISHLSENILRMSEPPFVPRERLLKKQQYFQNVHKHTYLKGPYDKITSVAIPIALAATAGYMIVRGIYNMSHGIGKKE